MTWHINKWQLRFENNIYLAGAAEKHFLHFNVDVVCTQNPTAFVFGTDYRWVFLRSINVVTSKFEKCILLRGAIRINAHNVMLNVVRQN